MNAMHCLLVQMKVDDRTRACIADVFIESKLPFTESAEEIMAKQN